MKSSLLASLTIVCTLISARSAMAIVPLNLTTRYAHNSNVADHRSGGDGDFNLSNFEFVFGLRLTNGDFHRSQLQVGLPLRTLQMASGTSTQTGSEFGGYKVALNQTFWDFLGWDASYISNTSNRLGLFEDNQSFENLLSVKAMAFLNSAFLVKAVAGPGVRLSSNFGPMYIARAGLELMWQNDTVGRLAIGADSSFRRRASNSQNDEANLFILEPQVSWEIVNDLWVSAQYTHTLARPKGYEQAMGDAGLSGLYGDSLSIGLSTTSW